MKCLNCGKAVLLSRGLCRSRCYGAVCALIKSGRTTEEEEVRNGRMLPKGGQKKARGLDVKQSNQVSLYSEPDVSIRGVESLGSGFAAQRCGGGRRILRGGMSD